MSVKRSINHFCKDLTSPSERGQMVRSAGLTAGFKVASIAIAFGASLVYARALGPHGYGLYAYVIAWASLLTIPVTLGLPRYLLREASTASASVRWLRQWADLRVVAVGVIAAIVMACVWFVPQAAGARWLFLVAAILPVLTALQRVRTGLLRSQNRIASSQWPVLIADPAFMLVVLVIIWSVSGRLYPIELVAAMVVATLVSLAINALQLRRLTVGQAAIPVLGIRLRSALPFMWLGGLNILMNRTDILMLGSLEGAHDAGIYAIAVRAAMLVPFVEVAANRTLAPRIARLYRQNDQRLLQRMISAAARRVFIVTLPFACVLAVAAWWLLYYLYGAQFTPAARPMQILIVAQLVVIGFGSARTILNMTGQETACLSGLGIGVALNIGLNFALIPPFGVDGAAMATGCSLVVTQIILWFLIRQKTGLRSSALGY